ncbi:MAG: sodium:calcium antiporter, partial [Alphaproteobacteria bacterium]|nr:sodium:calcium antiporter [Alphaproteobacteria bacterium]
MLQIIGLIAGGLVLLSASSNVLISGSVMVARRLKLSDLLIGIVLVGFTTSMPELMASAVALRIGQPQLAIGNIIGSNSVNILFILGLCVLLRPVSISDNKAFRLNALFLF